MKLKRAVSLLLVLLMLACLTACEASAEDVISVLDDVTDILLEEAEAPENESRPDSPGNTEPEEPVLPEQEENLPEEGTDPSEAAEEAGYWLPDKDGWYYDLASVVLYVDTYGMLPSNFVTKAEAEDEGWSGGSVQKYIDGAAIGGSHFGNYEGLLPKAPDRSWTECDIDTDDSSSRGAKRLVFSNDGLYYYTDDHYETFHEVICENGEVIIK